MAGAGEGEGGSAVLRLAGESSLVATGQDRAGWSKTGQK